MPDVLGIEAAAQAILDGGRLTETGPLTQGSPAFDAGDAHGLIAGGIEAGAVARGGQSLLVQGDLLGTPERPCTVQAEDEVVILGAATGATVTAPMIRIRGPVRQCRLAAAATVEIGDDLAATRLIVGALDVPRRQIEAARVKAEQAAQERVLLEQRLKIEEKRVDKLFRTTRFVCQVDLGQLIRVRSDRIQINLHPFYQVIGSRSGEEVDQALLEFFSRAVVGRLAHANRGYLQTNPNHQKVFTRVLADLRELFLLTRQLDHFTEERDRANAAVRAAVDAVRQQDPRIRVAGGLLGEIELQLVQAEVEEGGSGPVTLRPQSHRLTIAAAGPTGQQIKQVDPAGAESSAEVPAENLRSLCIRIEAGQLAWGPLGQEPR
jgi:hypothetical protein